MSRATVISAIKLSTVSPERCDTKAPPAVVAREAGGGDGFCQCGELVVDAAVTNSGAGHTLPGGVTLRNIILVVEARDRTGHLLKHLGGKQEKLPPLAGVGDTSRDLSGRPGKMFARHFVTKTGMVPAGVLNCTEK